MFAQLHLKKRKKRSLVLESFTVTCMRALGRKTQIVAQYKH